ncbi:hypothetical protein BATR1942_14515 [Bacillus atrophaeus 1942]|uniref:Uncharacterized protein n=1 Tax=Bacillus atrophaeus (strain 1942) TaxID=720555 RepID=A0ABM5M102_BACA1|nr:hypothetical protein BATR1942_14515 [Bacillus atrophaeus 1942]AKL86305.1 hypothetical protein D068_cds34980 [Bacillus atrophaeus UCMB-5137]EIM10836.1 hypothetical protein UY9_10347 [Bacillus atrophaeus C89]KYD06199.1 hypothetical protein B4144_3491 [Bacillus atrophaeus]
MLIKQAGILAFGAKANYSGGTAPASTGFPIKPAIFTYRHPFDIRILFSE